jgi:hypothetical protein
MREPVAKPAKPRSLVEIVDAAINVINPPDEARELCRDKVEDRLRRELGRPLPIMRKRPAIMGLSDCLKRLRAARRAAALIPLEWLCEHLDRDIFDVQEHIVQVHGLPRQKGSKRLNPHACSAVRAAADLLDPSVERARAHLLSLFPDDPRQIARYQQIYGDLGYECPWRQELTLYDDGTWHQLSLLLYEALADKPIPDLMHYCRKIQK